ncbi:MAG TPA: ribonuclease E/G, partial [Candidatus Krumholzibacteria bacterium]|nr:ribonuclease E/G [Candidatus Krumholzibacteria bacterium]
MVSVDVNTGRFTGKRNQEDTITETNLYAAKEVARQLRLRDIGGIIVVDFIDMESEANKKRVERELTTALKRDRARTKVFPISKLGLIEMSRQRVRPSLTSFLSDDCPYCKGTGKVLSLATLANRVEREVHRVFHRTGEKVVQIRCNPMLAMHLLREKAEQIEELCEEHGMSIDILDDPALHRESFQVVSLRTDRDLLREIDRQDGAAGDGRPRGRGNRRKPVSATTSGSRGAASPSASPKRAPQPERVKERLAESAAEKPAAREQAPRERAPREAEPRETEPRRADDEAGGIVGSPRGRTRAGRRRGRRGGRGRRPGEGEQSNQESGGGGDDAS